MVDSSIARSNKCISCSTITSCCRRSCNILSCYVVMQKDKSSNLNNPCELVRFYETLGEGLLRSVLTPSTSIWGQSTLIDHPKLGAFEVLRPSSLLVLFDSYLYRNKGGIVLRLGSLFTETLLLLSSSLTASRPKLLLR